MSIKRILGGKSKNLFDISKFIDTNSVKRIGNTLVCSSYGTSIGTLESLCPTLKVNDTITISFKCTSQGVASDYININNHIFRSGSVFIASELGLSNPIYLYNTDYANRNIPNKTTYSDIQIELGSTATEYVPYELTSYKSIMKVSDVCQLLDKSRYPATIINNGVTFTNNEDGTITLNGTNIAGGANLYTLMNVSVKAGHYYYIYSGQAGTWGTCMFTVDYSISASKVDGYIGLQRASYNDCAAYLFIGGGATFNNYVVKPQFFDLTEMFGAGNEPKTVAEFKAKFPNDYYPYSPSCFVTSYEERMPCKTKNLFSSSTEVETLEGGFGGPSVARNFEENKWYQGFTTNGYYGPSSILDFDIRPNSLYIYGRGSGYGMSRAIKCEPNTKYLMSCSYSHVSGGNGAMYVGYFDENGNFISNLNMDGKYKFSITTPSNCKWLIINFVTNGVGKAYFSDIQLEKGSTATDYVPYEYV